MTWTFKWNYDWPGEKTREIQNAWREGWERSRFSHAFQNPKLAEIWVRTIAKPLGQSYVLMIAEDGQRTLYYPLMIQTSRWRRGWRKELIGLDETVFEYQDPLVDGPPMNLTQWNAFWLALCGSTAKQGFHLAHIAHLQYVGTLSSGSPSPRMRCDFAIAAPALLLHQYGSFEELVQSLPRSQRSEVRRNLNRVKNWNPQLKVFRRTDVAGALEMFEGMLIAYQAQHWGRRQLFISPQKVEFYQEVIRVGLPAGWLHVSILEVDSRPISWFLGFDWNDTLSWYRFCYAVDAENLSPGRLHLCFLLMRGFEEGLKVFDLLIGDEPYKMKWTSFTRSFYRLMWYPPNLLGSMSYLGSHVAKAWPRLSG